MCKKEQYDFHISAKKILIHPKDLRTYYISSKKTCIFPKKLTDIRAYAGEIDRALKRERKRLSYRQVERARNNRRNGGGKGGRGGERKPNWTHDQNNSKDNYHPCMTKQNDYHVCACDFL